MKHTLSLGVLALLLMSGCSQEHKEEHSLDCVLKSVVYIETGKEVTFKREDAIRNGFEYYFKVYDDGIVIVNDTDVYIKDKDIQRSYSLLRTKKVDKNMKFQFSQAFNDVKFLIVDIKQEYRYNCSNVESRVNK